MVVLKWWSKIFTIQKFGAKGAAFSGCSIGRELNQSVLGSISSDVSSTFTTGGRILKINQLDHCF
jgi:hypothetical protein